MSFAYLSGNTSADRSPIFWEIVCRNGIPLTKNILMNSLIFYVFVLKLLELVVVG